MTKTTTTAKKNSKVSPQQSQATAKQPDLKEFLSDDPNFSFTISWQEVAPVYNQVLRSGARKIKQPGFRPGKVPPSLAEDLLDEGYLIREVLQKLAPQAYQTALKAQTLRPFCEPEIVIKKAVKNQDWQLTAYLPQKPLIKLPDYKKFLQQQKKLVLEKIATEKKASKSPETSTKQAAADQALIALLQEIKPKVSLIMVRRSAQKEWERLQSELAAHQLTLATYLQKMNLTTQEMEAQLMWGALQNLQIEFILDALLEAEKITASEAEIKQKMKKSFKDLNSEQLAAQYEQERVRNYFSLLVQREKLAKWLSDL